MEYAYRKFNLHKVKKSICVPFYGTWIAGCDSAPCSLTMVLLEEHTGYDKGAVVVSIQMF